MGHYKFMLTKKYTNIAFSSLNIKSNAISYSLCSQNMEIKAFDWILATNYFHN